MACMNRACARAHVSGLPFMLRHRPRSIRPFFACCSTIAVVLLAVVLAARPSAAGNDNAAGGEADIGTFELEVRPGVTAPRAAPGGQASLFARAETKLEAGDSAGAQRLLEQVIAFDPDAPLATRARRLLGDLYRMAPALRAEPSAARPPPISLDGLDPIMTRPAPADVPPRRSPAQPSAATGATRSAELGTPRSAAGSGTMRLGALSGQVEAVPHEVEMTFVMAVGDRVFFSNGSADLGGRGRAAVAAQAQWLLKNPQYHARIEGHADDPPLRPEAQEELAEARAATVRDALVRAGVEAGRLGIVPWGRERRVAECDGSDCEAQNQRAVTVLALPSANSDRGAGAGRRTAP